MQRDENLKRISNRKKKLAIKCCWLNFGLATTCCYLLYSKWRSKWLLPRKKQLLRKPQRLQRKKQSLRRRSNLLPPSAVVSDTKPLLGLPRECWYAEQGFLFCPYFREGHKLCVCLSQWCVPLQIYRCVDQTAYVYQGTGPHACYVNLIAVIWWNVGGRV